MSAARSQVMWSGPKQSVDVESLPPAPPLWAWSELGAVASIRARIGWKALTASEYLDDGYVFLATPNIKSSAIDFENVNYISDFRYLESPELQLQIGDVLLAKDGATLGLTNVVRHLPRPATVNGSIAVIRPFEIDGHFLNHYLASSLAQGMMQMLRGGMGVPHLFQSDLRKLPVPVPPRAQQQVIVDFLDRETGLIDALVHAKRRMIELLDERRRQTVWMLTRHGMSVGPDRDTGVPWVGRIPPRWEVAPLKRLGHITSGVTFPPEYQGVSGEELGYLKVSDFNSEANARDILSTRHTVSHQTAADLGAYIFPTGTVIFPKIGAALLSNRRRVLAIPCCADQNLMGVVLRQGNWRYFAWQLEGVDVARLAMPGPIPFINEAEVGELTVAVPPLDEQDEIAERLDQDVGKIERTTRQAEASVSLLAERRQALITAAVTGATDIP